MKKIMSLLGVGMCMFVVAQASESKTLAETTKDASSTPAVRTETSVPPAFCVTYLRSYITCPDGAVMLVGYYGHIIHDCNTGMAVGGTMDYISASEACENHQKPETRLL
jgi:hypothetical protein